jgi:hypothetical protein
MTVVAGLDTFKRIEDWPAEGVVGRETMRLAEQLRRLWNHSAIAFVPHCMVDKAPLDWHSGEDGVLFSCPKCSRVWRVVD